MTDETTTYEDRGEYLKAVADPAYAESARYRDGVAAKLQRSLDAGTVTPMGQRVAPYSDRRDSRVATFEAEGVYGELNPMPKADPVWAEAIKVGSGFFDGPESIALAMAAPQFDLDAGYREAVHAKITRSINERWITADFTPVDPSRRFTRG
jgi:hypothetical protein